MNSYDPRTPIIKATEDEQDEVSGHIRHARGPLQEPVDGSRFETDDVPEVEKRLSAIEDEDDDPEVEGNRHARL